MGKKFETEIYKQSRTANFQTRFETGFDFSEIQEFQVQLFDKRLGGNFLLGEATFTLGEFIGLNDGYLELEIKRSQTVMGALEMEFENKEKEKCVILSSTVKELNLITLGLLTPFLRW